jgi:hypothetical protein
MRVILNLFILSLLSILVRVLFQEEGSLTETLLLLPSRVLNVNNLVYLIKNTVIFLVIYFVILMIYLIFENVFLMRTLYSSINKILFCLLIFGIIYHIGVKWAVILENFYRYYFIMHLFQVLINLLVVRLLYRNLYKLHKKQVQGLLDYPTLQKAIHIKFLEKKTYKNNRMEERKRIREQLEEKYLEDLKI